MSTVRLHAAPEGALPSPDYSITVNGAPLFAYHQPGMAHGTVSYAIFDFDGPVEVRITSNWNVYSADVRPASYAIPSRLEGNTVVFTLREPRNLWVRWNESFELPFYLFAGPLEEPPSPDAPGVRFISPGIHHLGQITLTSDETLYLAPGAFVYGTVQAHGAQNVAVRGRGILCGSHIPFGGLPNGPTELLGIFDSSDVVVEGVTLLDAFGWTLVLYGCDRAQVANVRIINERVWSTDGINPVNCCDVLIAGCFVRAKDDCVSIKGLEHPPRYDGQWQPIRDVVVRDCVFWSENNNGVVVGSETRATVVERISFVNCDILKTTNSCGDLAGALSIICLDDTLIQAISFEDIRIEHAGTPLINVYFAESLFSGTIRGSKRPEGGTLRDVRFRRISVTGGPRRRSYLNGLDDRHVVEDVQFEDLTIHGEPITSLEQGWIVPNAFTRGVELH